LMDAHGRYRRAAEGGKSAQQALMRRHGLGAAQPWT
jgi:hypothetical protein